MTVLSLLDITTRKMLSTFIFFLISICQL
jgi:hypothetical protein